MFDNIKRRNFLWSLFILLLNPREFLSVFKKISNQYPIITVLAKPIRCIPRTIKTKWSLEDIDLNTEHLYLDPSVIKEIDKEILNNISKELS